MKRILVILLLFSWTLNAQTIFRVNNLPGVTGVNVYTTIQDAHDAASDGDIIYVEPSLNSYGSLTCTKRLTILGNGYYLDSNATKNYSLRSSILHDIVLNDGSDNSSLKGLTFNSLTGNSVDGIIMKRCYGNLISLIGVSTVENCSNWIVSQSRLSIIYGDITYKPTNCVFSNNIFSQYIIYTGTNCLIENNTFFYGGQFQGLDGTDIFNNIFLVSDCDACIQSPFIIHTTGARIENNIIVTRNTGTGNISQLVLPSGDGNVNGAAYEDCFKVSDPFNGDISNDNHVTLSNSSPAKGIGKNGTDAGAFGGVNPYVLAGQIPYPIITDFKSTGAGNASVPLQIDITVKGNN